MSLQQFFETRAARKPGIDVAIDIVNQCRDNLSERKLVSTPEEQQIIDMTVRHIVSLLQIEQDWCNHAIDTINRLYRN